jgi:hypothetical protein
VNLLLTKAPHARAQAGAAWAAGDFNVARPGGAYGNVEAETPAACERICADDTICMAWSFQANACELKAIVPAAHAQNGAISGVSARAPASLRVRFEAPAPATSPAIVADIHEEDAPASAPPPEDEISMALLGAPETAEGLRGSLGN